MKTTIKAPQNIVELMYVIPPREQGQPHRTAWAYDPETERLIRRTFDWDEDNFRRFSNLRYEYRSFEMGRRGEFDPVNGEVNAIGKGRFIGVSPA